MNHSMVGSQAGEVKANGISIAYESFGKSSNPAIILIQGMGATLVHFCKSHENRL
jgi:hypothetical protein